MKCILAPEFKKGLVSIGKFFLFLFILLPIALLLLGAILFLMGYATYHLLPYGVSDFFLQDHKAYASLEDIMLHIGLGQLLAIIVFTIVFGVSHIVYTESKESIRQKHNYNLYRFEDVEYPIWRTLLSYIIVCSPPPKDK